MGYKTDVRLITTLKGFREIKKFAEDVYKKLVEIQKVIDKGDF